MMFKSNRIGELLLREQKITAKQLDEALVEQKRQGGQSKIGNLLIQKGFIDEETLLHFLSKQFGLPMIDLSRIEFDPALVEHYPGQHRPKIRNPAHRQRRGHPKNGDFRSFQYLCPG